MASSSPKRTRSQRVAALELPPGMIDRCFDVAQRPAVLLRLAIACVAGALLWGMVGGWAPPFGFREGYTPQRDVTSRVKFERPDPDATLAEKKRQADLAFCVYENDPTAFDRLHDELYQRLVTFTSAPNLQSLEKPILQEFFPPPAPGQPVPTEEELEQRFQKIRQNLPTVEALRHVETVVADAFRPYQVTGLLEELPKEHKQGQTEKILVVNRGAAPSSTDVRVRDVQIGRAEWLRAALKASLDPVVVDPIFDWIRPRIPTTLKYLPDETRQQIELAVSRVEPINFTYKPGDALAKAGEPLTLSTLENLRLEYQAMRAALSLPQCITYSLATLGMYIALTVLIGVYVVNHELRLVVSLRNYVTMLVLILCAIGAAVLASQSTYRAEMIPVLLFGMTVAIAYHQELALLLVAAVTMVIVSALGYGFSEFVILTATSAATVLLVRPIRSRRKLTYVGLAAGAVAILTTLGVEILDQQPFQPTVQQDALGFGLCAFLSGLLMTALLPFIESLFGVQTEISLLELGDVAHPLLQELVRRAPGTYNHSINVASLAEAAADSIGAHGLLVRVGAYFHDIGKMLKAGYFVENQGTEANRHDGLHPAMSTLIIIAHIKDGADLARQHHLPQCLIDFILQHHGTTLVEYFYRRASQQSEAHPELGEVEESAFRYPGPKPQTREAAVLMIADAVESACRSLVEPTPARIENLVQSIAMKRLLDGQFDESGLTLQELATVQQSLVKSLTAVYHCRIKYPDALPEPQRIVSA